ncbi:MAG: sigma-70 family RNA polymerase sigma factor [Acidimicrobiales bacterium]
MPAPADLTALCLVEHPHLVALLGLLTGDRAEAEDLAQEVLIRLCRDWEKVSRYDKPGAWVQRVAVNLARSAHRRHRRELRALSRLAVATSTSVEPDSIKSDDAVRAALQRLPFSLRAVIVLRFLDDLSVAQTATVLRIPQGTVKTRTRKALDQLRGDEAIGMKEAVHVD